MDNKDTVTDVDSEGRVRRATRRAALLVEMQAAEAASLKARQAYEAAYAESIRLHTASTNANLRVLQLQDEYNFLKEL